MYVFWDDKSKGNFGHPGIYQVTEKATGATRLTPAFSDREACWLLDKCRGECQVTELLKGSFRR